MAAGEFFTYIKEALSRPKVQSVSKQARTRGNGPSRLNGRKKAEEDVELFDDDLSEEEEYEEEDDEEIDEEDHKPEIVVEQPKLKGKYKEAYEAWKKGIAANAGVEKRNRSNCAPPGMPGIMQIPQYPFEFLLTPGRVTINQEAWMQTRHIFTDGRPHDAGADPSFMGDSIGHWEGDTLVAETVAIKDSVPLGMGMTHSDRMRITERIHLKPGDPDTLLNEITVDDPEALAEPWHNTAVYHRDRYGQLLEFECAENDRNPVDEQGNTKFD